MSDSQLLLVKTESPVRDTSSKLYRWDSNARQYHQEFEINIASLLKGIAGLHKNPLTNFRDPV